MHRSPNKKTTLKKSSSLIISLPYPPNTTPPLTDNTSLLPPNSNSHSNPPNNFSARHSQLPSLSSPSYSLNSIPPDDTNIDNSSNNSTVHIVWQSTKTYPPTPPPMKYIGIPLLSVNCIITPPKSPAKVYSSGLDYFNSNSLSISHPHPIILLLLFSSIGRSFSNLYSCFRFIFSKDIFSIIHQSSFYNSFFLAAYVISKSPTLYISHHSHYTAHIDSMINL